MFQKILLGFDGSEGARRALERAADLARASGARLYLVGVGRLPEYAETAGEIEEAREQAEAFYGRRLEEAQRALQKLGVEAVTHVTIGKPSEQILRIAAEFGVDLIVLGVHPHHPLRRRLLGGTADKIVDSAECSVLVVR